MTSPNFSGGVTEMTQVRKLRVAIRADGSDYEGYVHLLEDGSRVQDVLNDPRPFLNLSDVVYNDQHHAYVALNKGAITHLLLLEPVPAVEEAPRRAPAAKRASDALSPAALKAARQPSVPAAGPRTLPAPPPPGAQTPAGDPPTQPFPKEALISRGGHDDDLLLDEDDDIDPDDLERDVAALITGPSR